MPLRDIGCNIAYTPVYFGQPPMIALLSPYSLSNITSFVRLVIPLSAEHGHGNLVLFRSYGLASVAADTDDSNWFLITSRLNPDLYCQLVHN